MKSSSWQGGFLALPEGGLAGGVLLTIHRLSQGGADRVAILLANGFVAAGIPTALCMLRDGGENEQALLSMLDERVRVGCAGSPMGSRHLELIRGYRHIRREIERARPSLVLASSSNMGLVTGLCARSSGPHRPAFLMKLTNPVIRPRDHGAVKEYYRRSLYRFIFGSFDRVLLLSAEEQRRLTAMFPEHRDRFETVANPYVAPAMRAAPRAGGSRGRRIVTLARMMPQKRLDRLLDAFALLSNKEARLTILGDGPERAKLERRANALGIGARVDMPGFVDDVPSRLAAADLFVLSSDYEGLPAVLFEALACGVPVVTTDCFDAARSLLQGLPGCATVPRNDVAALARAIDRALSLPEFPEGLDAIAHPYSYDKAIAAHVDLLQACLSVAQFSDPSADLSRSLVN